MFYAKNKDKNLQIRHKTDSRHIGFFNSSYTLCHSRDKDESNDTLFINIQLFERYERIKNTTYKYR